MVKPGEKKKRSSQPVNLPSAWPLIKPLGEHLNTLCLSGRIGKVVEGSRVWHMCVKVSERLSPISFTELRESNPKSPFLYS